MLVDKAFSSLAADATQLLTLQHFMSQIKNVQITFAIRQGNPTTVEKLYMPHLSSSLIYTPSKALDTPRVIS